MSVKTILIVLTIVLYSSADIIHILAEGLITQIDGAPSSPNAGTFTDAVESSIPSPFPAIDDPLSVELFIDTDRQGMVITNGVVQDPKVIQTSSGGIQATSSYFPQLITPSVFPDIYNLYLNSDNNMIVRNARFFTTTDPLGSDYTIVEYALGTFSTDQPDISLLNFYFLSVFFMSDVDAVYDGQKAIIIEGFVNSRIVDNAQVTSVTYVKSSDARLATVTRQVPEPPVTTLLGTALLGSAAAFCVSGKRRDTRFRNR